MISVFTRLSKDADQSGEIVGLDFRYCGDWARKVWNTHEISGSIKVRLFTSSSASIKPDVAKMEQINASCKVGMTHA